jgi:hypothetical protein
MRKKEKDNISNQNNNYVNGYNNDFEDDHLGMYYTNNTGFGNHYYNQNYNNHNQYNNQYNNQMAQAYPVYNQNQYNQPVVIDSSYNYHYREKAMQEERERAVSNVCLFYLIWCINHTLFYICCLIMGHFGHKSGH